MWGIENQDDEASDRLPARLPRTIEGAIQATRELGLDYLWVDKYCIPQHNEEEKRNQINNMHRIYQQAHVTIVAAAGTGPHYGLPGLSFSRAPPAHIVIDNRSFVALPGHPLLDGAVQQSRWKTRAWTYQEEFFSRRILYFTDSQVVFNCKQNSTGIEDPIRNHAHPEVRPFIDDPQYEISWVHVPGYIKSSLEMDKHICTINERQITYETDRVNTIAGIFSHLKATGKIMGHLSGVPIWGKHTEWTLKNGSWDAEAGFLSGLAWLMASPEGRRSEFPSWT